MEEKKKYSLKEILKEWIWLSRYIKKHWKGIFLSVIFGIIAVLTGIAISIASKNLIDTVTLTRDKNSLLNAIIWIISLLIGQIITHAVFSWINSLIYARTINEVREDLFKSILAAKWEKLSKYHSGEILNRLEGDVNNISNGITTFIPNLITGSVQFIAIFAVIFYFDKTMALISLLSAPILIVSARFLMLTMKKYNRKMREVNGEILSFNEEVFQNIQFVKAFSLSKEYYKNLGTLLGSYRKVRLAHDKFSILITSLLSFIGIIVSYACYGWGVYQLWNEVISYGVMIMFLQLATMLRSSFSSLVGLVPTCVSCATSAGRIMEIVNLEAECGENSAEAEEILKASKNEKIYLNVENLTFKYSDASDTVLKNVNINIKSGETIALVGPSGGGKTTMLRLLLGLLQADDGGIYVYSENTPNRKVLISDSTRMLCTYVAQENNIFSGTVASNLRIVNQQATDEEIIEALKMADAWDFVSNLPNGIETVLGERAVNLSEGQRQRIAIARSLLRDAPILIMDEATSALDPETEKRVLKNIMTNNPRRICIMTTHRLSMLDYADYVYKIDESGVTNVPNN